MTALSMGDCIALKCNPPSAQLTGCVCVCAFTCVITLDICVKGFTKSEDAQSSNRVDIFNKCQCAVAMCYHFILPVSFKVAHSGPQRCDVSRLLLVHAS